MLPLFSSLLLNILNILLFLVLFYNFLVCCFRDPGAIPTGSVSRNQAGRRIRQQDELNKFKYITQEAYEMDEVVDDNLDTSREVYRPSRNQHEDVESTAMTGN